VIPIPERSYFGKVKCQRPQVSLPTPSVLDLWTGDEEISGAMLISFFIDGAPAPGMKRGRVNNSPSGENYLQSYTPSPGCPDSDMRENTALLCK